MAYSIDTGLVLAVGVGLFVAAYGVYAAVCRKIGRKLDMKESAPKAAFWFYLLILICFTLLPVLVPPIQPQKVEINFNPAYLLWGMTDRAALIGVAGNIMLFMPLSILGMMSNIRQFKSVRGATIIALFFRF